MTARLYHHGKYEPQDYPEDEEPSGKGMYYCKCHNCKRDFMGYKGRLTCKVCDQEYQALLAAMTESERQSHEEEKLKLLAEAVNSLRAEK